MGPEHTHNHCTPPMQPLPNVGVLRFLKDPVGTINELYTRYPDGGEYGWFALCTDTNQFAVWDTETETWKNSGFQLRDQIQDVANNSFKSNNLSFESTEFNSALVVDTYTILTTVGSFGISFEESPILYRGVTDTNYTLLVEYASASMLGQGAKQDFTHTLKLQDGREFIRTLRHKTDNTGWEYSEFFEKKESVILPAYSTMLAITSEEPFPCKTDILVLEDEQNNPGKKSMYTWWPDGTIMYHMLTKDINDL